MGDYRDDAAVKEPGEKRMKFSMGRRLIFFVVTAVVVWTLFGYFSSKTSAAQAKSAEYTDSSKTIKTKVGQEFVIVLDSNPTTGYGWKLAGEIDKKILSVVEISHKTSKRGMIGAGGKDRWTFKGLRAGTVTLSLQYVRPWEKGVPPAKKEDFTVTIQ